jgi:hypothetical protein
MALDGHRWSFGQQQLQHDSNSLSVADKRRSASPKAISTKKSAAAVFFFWLNDTETKKKKNTEKLKLTKTKN